ncbi:MAG: glycosyltransferase [Deltaproteobacteria bacterium]|nr:glycosyltransferase [Deltaproteobacteria bacterium]
MEEFPRMPTDNSSSIKTGLLTCDLVLPVFNGLTYVKDCIEALLACTGDCSYRLYIIDDASDRYTATFLEQQAATYSHISVLRLPQNQGFVRACNLGIAQGSAPYVVLVNSDVIVTPGWLSRLVRCAESDPSIAAVNPLTNRATHLDIPLALGANFYDMDALLAQRSPRHYPDVVTGVGFCLLLRRAALDQVGVFDEIYGQGYCEDSDLCMRLVAHGYRTVVADDVYVYHKGSASFLDRGTRYRHNRTIFDARWAAEYQRQFRVFRQQNPLQPVRDLFQLPRRWEPLTFLRREGGRQFRRLLKGERLPVVAKDTVRAVLRVPTATRAIVTPETVARFTRPGRLRVTYVLRSLALAGGVLSVIQLVNELILLGVEARLVALRDDGDLAQWKLLTQPILFTSKADLHANFPESDIAVATWWITAPWVADVVRTGRAKQGVYFLQDYESWFFPETDHRRHAWVKDTYNLLPWKIVKSEWLKRMLAQDGFPTYKISLGMDLGVFYPRDRQTHRPLTVLAMTRPETPRRGFPDTVAALRMVKAAMPEVEIVVFGDARASSRIPFVHRNVGVVADRNRLAELYAQADIFLDGSTFQGFGRPALEAMACGAACVLTNVGGVSEYARDGENCLLLPPRQPDRFADAILMLLRNADFRKTLSDGGLRTVQAYCHKREARDTLAYFTSLMEGRVQL